MTWSRYIGCQALAVVAALCWIPPASATIVISGDPGGPIPQYEQRFAMMRAIGETVVIDGRCFSACTMVLGLVPPDRLCVTPRARLGFHAAWFPDMAGGRVFSREDTRRLHDSYPPAVRHWIARRGGLSAKMLILEGPALRAMVPSCQLVAAPRRAFPPAGHTLEISAYHRTLGRGL